VLGKDSFPMKSHITVVLYRWGGGVLNQLTALAVALWGMRCPVCFSVAVVSQTSSILGYLLWGWRVRGSVRIWENMIMRQVFVFQLSIL
jgi:hypothetical protein